MALFGFDQDPGQVESFSFFFFEGKQVECFTENEHHPQVESLSPPARSEWHGFPPPGIHDDPANGRPGTKWKAASTAAERPPPRHPRLSITYVLRPSVGSSHAAASNLQRERKGAFPRRRHDSKRSDATCCLA